MTASQEQKTPLNEEADWNWGLAEEYFTQAAEMVSREPGEAQVRALIGIGHALLTISSELLVQREREIEAMRCVDCGSLEDYYMVKDEVWAVSGLAQNGGQLCVRDLERRIGRALIPEDFTEVEVNNLEYRFLFPRSQLLQDRLTRYDKP